MKRVSEFDKYASSYEDIHRDNIKFSGFSPDYFDEHKIKEIYHLLQNQNDPSKKISFLNYGCGIGKAEKFIKKYFPSSKIYSIDVSDKSIKVAQQNNKDLIDVEYKTFDGLEIPYDFNFDLIYTANVFHHIHPSKHFHVLSAIYSKLAEKGLFFIFEHNPLNPITLKTIRECIFDEKANFLKPGYTNKILKKSGFKSRKLRFIIFFPQFLSILLPLEKYLYRFPLGAQYYFIAKKYE